MTNNQYQKYFAKHHNLGKWVNYVPDIQIRARFTFIPAFIECFLRYGYNDTESFFYLSVGFTLPLIECAFGILIPDYKTLMGENNE